MSFLLSAYTPPPSSSSSQQQHQDRQRHRGRPSFFEVYAQHHMMSSLRFAVRYILAIMAERGWRGTHWMLQNNKEIFSVFRGIVENYFLNTYDSSFSEYFYGLKRVQLKEGSSVDGNHRLSFHSRKIALFLLIGVPYIKDKLDDTYTEMFGSITPSGFEPHPFQLEHFSHLTSESSFSFSSITSRIKYMFYRIYPYANAAYEGSFFIYCLLYLFERTWYFTPLLHLQHHALRRLSLQDMMDHQKIEAQNNKIQSISSSSSSSSSSRISQILHNTAAIARTVLIAAVFLIKFMEWWYRSEEHASSSTTHTHTVAIPHPPPQPSLRYRQRRSSHPSHSIHNNNNNNNNNSNNNNSNNNNHLRNESNKSMSSLSSTSNEVRVSIPQDRRVCPLCRRIRRNATLLTCSGFVFCYGCISQHIQGGGDNDNDNDDKLKDGYCPVTGIRPATTMHLRRIYNDSH